MTRRDFQLIADVLRDAKRDWAVDTDAGCLDAIAFDFAVRLAHENPRFNRDLFLRAAGYPLTFGGGE